MNKTKNAPHLPNDVLTDWQKERWKRIIWFLIALLCSAAAGAVASLWVIQGISSLLPQSNNQTTIIVSNENATQENFTLDPLVHTRVSQRIVHVRDARKKIQGYVEENAFIGQAVVLNAGGWAVLYNNPETVQISQWKNWEVVDYQGKKFELTNIIPDTSSGLIYIHIDGEDFRGDLRFNHLQGNLQQKTNIFAAIGKDQFTPITLLELKNIPLEQGIPFASITKQYPIVGTASIGDPIMNPSGEFVGFVNENKELLGSWVVAYQLQSILKDAQLTSPNVSINVRAVQAQDTVPRAANRLGYYIESVQGTGITDSLAVRDVIIAIDGNPVEEIDIQKQLFLANRALELEIIRNNETKIVDVKFSP